MSNNPTILNQRVLPAPCGLPEDPRCSLDPIFAADRPSLCPNNPIWVLKPSQATVCASGTIQFTTFLTAKSEAQVTSGLTYASSNPAAVTINAGTGLATLVGAGVTTISVTDGTNYAYGQVNVIGAGSCNAGICDFQVETVIALDNSRSMSQTFTPAQPNKLIVAKRLLWSMLAALQTKDLATLLWFNSAASIQVPATNVIDDLQDGLRTIPSANRPTNIANAFNSALAALSTSPETKKCVVIVSDGNQRPMLSLTETAELIDNATQFKAAGGVVICIGLRAMADGWVLLRNLASGGYFLNILPNTDLTAATNYLLMLMGLYCAGPQNPAISGTAQPPDGNPLTDDEADFIWSPD